MIYRFSLLTVLAWFPIVLSAQTWERLRYPDSTLLFEGHMSALNGRASLPEHIEELRKTGPQMRPIDPLRPENPFGTNWRYDLNQAFREMRLDGPCRLYYRNGQLMVLQYFRDGIADGRYEEYDSAGNTRIACSYRDGRLNGRCTVYFRDGKPKFRGSFDASTREAVDATYPRWNAPRSADTVQRGRPLVYNPLSLYCRLGELRWFVESESALLAGRYEFFYPGGAKMAVMEYRQSLPHNTWEWWDWKGTRTDMVEFRDGQLTAVYDAGQKKYSVQAYKALEAARKKELGEMPVAPSERDSVQQEYYEHPDVPAQPLIDMNAWVAEYLQYPPDAVAGTVVLKLLIRLDGYVAKIEVEKSLSPSCDAAATALFSRPPRWKPGRHSFYNVHSFVRQEVRFDPAAQKPKR